MPNENIFENGRDRKQMRKRKLHTPALIDTKGIKVRFSEVDYMQIVWHGEYIRYFEDGRESFGEHYKGLGYLDIYNNGFVTPIVDISCQYKQPLGVGDQAMVETRYIDTAAAKILFEYVIYKLDDNSIIATGSTMQVFLNRHTHELELQNPQFYLDWKKRWGII